MKEQELKMDLRHESVLTKRIICKTGTWLKNWFIFVLYQRDNFVYIGHLFYHGTFSWKRMMSTRPITVTYMGDKGVE